MNDFFVKLSNTKYSIYETFLIALIFGLMAGATGYYSHDTVQVQVPVQKPAVDIITKDIVLDSTRLAVIEKTQIGSFMLNSRYLSEDIISDFEEIPGIDICRTSGKHGISFFISKAFTEKEVFKSIHDLLNEREEK